MVEGNVLALTLVLRLLTSAIMDSLNRVPVDLGLFVISVTAWAPSGHISLSKAWPLKRREWERERDDIHYLPAMYRPLLQISLKKTDKIFILVNFAFSFWTVAFMDTHQNFRRMHEKSWESTREEKFLVLEKYPHRHLYTCCRAVSWSPEKWDLYSCQ